MYVHVHMGGRIAHTKPNQTCGRRLSLCPFQKLSYAIHFLRKSDYTRKDVILTYPRGRTSILLDDQCSGWPICLRGERGSCYCFTFVHQNLHTFSSLRLCVRTLSLSRWMRWCAKRAMLVGTSCSPSVKNLDEQDLSVVR